MDLARPELPVRPGRRSSISVRGFQVSVALLVIAEALCLSVGGFFVLVWIVWESWLATSVVALVAAALAAWPLLTGRWGRGPALALQVAGIVGVGGLNVWFAVSAGRSAIEAYDTRSTLGASGQETIGWLFVVAASSAVLAAVVAAVPRARRGRRYAVAAGVGLAALAVLASGSAVAVGITADRCGDFRFDGAAWRGALARDDASDDAERMAEALVRCRVLVGGTRHDVRRLLGTTRDMKGRTWTYDVGWVNDGLGPGDAQELLVHFSRSGRVRRSQLLWPQASSAARRRPAPSRGLASAAAGGITSR